MHGLLLVALYYDSSNRYNETTDIMKQHQDIIKLRQDYSQFEIGLADNILCIISGRSKFSIDIAAGDKLQITDDAVPIIDRQIIDRALSTFGYWLDLGYLVSGTGATRLVSDSVRIGYNMRAYQSPIRLDISYDIGPPNSYNQSYYNLYVKENSTKHYIKAGCYSAIDDISSEIKSHLTRIEGATKPLNPKQFNSESYKINEFNCITRRASIETAQIRGMGSINLDHTINTSCELGEAWYIIRLNFYSGHKGTIIANGNEFHILRGVTRYRIVDGIEPSRHPINHINNAADGDLINYLVQHYSAKAIYGET